MLSGAARPLDSLDRPARRADRAPARRHDLALVLGAGGARGFAHVGALSVIERHKIPFDLVLGVSMGSIVGAGYAAGLRAEAMLRVARGVRFGRLFRPRPGRVGLIDPSGVRDLLRDILGDRRFSDLDRELAVLSASLTTGEPIVIRDGPVVDAVLASIAVPLLFPPVARDGDHLIDGGMIDGLPIRLARELGARRVVAVDADDHACQSLRAPGLRHITGGVARALGRCSDPSRVGRRLVLSRMLAHVVTPRPPVSDVPDVLIQPTYRRLTSYHYHRWQRCVDLGREAALAALPDLLGMVGAATLDAPTPAASGTVRAAASA
jgi:NTE family protein